MGLLVLLTVTVGAAEPGGVSAVPADLRERLGLSPHYTRFLDAGGLPIVASEKVSDFALLEARHLVEQVTAFRPALLATIGKQKVRLAVMAASEFITDIPEHSGHTPKDFWNWSIRGLGATAKHPAFTCGEENLLSVTGDPSSGASTLIHELAHAIHDFAMPELDVTFELWLQETFDLARRDGLWEGTYATLNHAEYWAVGVEAWFDARRGAEGVNTRARLKEYDPRLAEMLGEVFGDGAWRYVRPGARRPPSAHLAGFNADAAPAFAWPAHLEAARERYFAGGEFRVAPLVRLGPAARIDWRSPRRGNASVLCIHNSVTATARLDWIDHEGRPRPHAVLRSGETVQSPALSGSVWRLSDETGWVLGYVVAGELPTLAVITPADAEAEP